jgi:transposase
MEFTEGFKKSMVEKLLTLGGKGITELSKEIGVCNQTLYNWRDRYINVEDIRNREAVSPRRWKIKDRYSAVLESAGLAGDDLGKWLRKTGLHSEHIELWKKEIELMVSSPKDKEEIRHLKKRNKELEKEILRKDKALAEMAALVILKKKLDAMWGDEEDSPHLKNGKKR